MQTDDDLTTGERMTLLAVYLVATTVTVAAAALTVHHIMEWFV